MAKVKNVYDLSFFVTMLLGFVAMPVLHMLGQSPWCVFLLMVGYLIGKLV